jgi:hypothetical protein
VKAILLGAISSLGLRDASYEFSGSLRLALADASSEERWLTGEDVFGEVTVSERPASTQRTIEYLSRMIAAHAP